MVDFIDPGYCQCRSSLLINIVGPGHHEFVRPHAKTYIVGRSCIIFTDRDVETISSSNLRLTEIPAEPDRPNVSVTKAKAGFVNLCTKPGYGLYLQRCLKTCIAEWL